MNKAEDAFQALILREVLLAEGLQADIQRAQLADWLGQRLAQPAAAALDYLVRLGTQGVLSLPKALTKQAIVTFFKSKGGLYSIRLTRAVLSRMFKEPEHTAHSYCRSALCYAVQGDYAEAETWLKSAEELVGDLARPRYIRGLMLGAQGQLDSADARFKAALEGRAKAETKGRITEAIEAVTTLALPPPSNESSSGPNLAP
jgi:tetratricopeptide (TPR) repeat protein